jgi:hypothetical protein
MQTFYQHLRYLLVSTKLLYSTLKKEADYFSETSPHIYH